MEEERLGRKVFARHLPGATKRKSAGAALATCVGAMALAASAIGGVTPPSGGGAAAPTIPTIRDSICISNCVGLRAATAGSVVQVTGVNLGAVDRMTFQSGSKRMVAPVSNPTTTTASAKVPKGATTGKVLVGDPYGNHSRLSPEEVEIHPISELGTAGALALTAAEVSPSQAYYFGFQAPRLNYIIGSDQKLNDLRIDVVDKNGGVVKSFFRNDIPANSTQSIRWDGKGTSGKPVSNGAYSFRVGSQSGERAQPSSRREGLALAFKLYGYIFPVRGPHTYGDGIGAPRAGHTHQGQDVLADCGLPLVAARGGRVQYNGYQGAAGNYIVIDGMATGMDFTYMHLAAPSPLTEGSVVHTGQRIGIVGDTGDATACHLHFEMWSAPGWYEGGHFLNPTPSLKLWDKYS